MADNKRHNERLIFVANFLPLMSKCNVYGYGTRNLRSRQNIFYDQYPSPRPFTL
jgi:hypothetical protein